jgi:hypothetical protein
MVCIACSIVALSLMLAATLGPRAIGADVCKPARSETSCPRGHEGGMQPQKRGWAPSIWEMSAKGNRPCGESSQ